MAAQVVDLGELLVEAIDKQLIMWNKLATTAFSHVQLLCPINEREQAADDPLGAGDTLFIHSQLPQYILAMRLPGGFPVVGGRLQNGLPVLLQFLEVIRKGFSGKGVEGEVHHGILTSVTSKSHLVVSQWGSGGTYLAVWMGNGTHFA